VVRKVEVERSFFIHRGVSVVSGNDSGASGKDVVVAEIDSAPIYPLRIYMDTCECSCECAQVIPAPTARRWVSRGTNCSSIRRIDHKVPHCLIFSFYFSFSSHSSLLLAQSTV
jgi:hypothetical protein